MEWIIEGLENRLKNEKEYLRKYKITGTHELISEKQDIIKDLVKAISVLNGDTEKRTNKSFCRCGILASYSHAGICNLCGLHENENDLSRERY